MILPEPWVPSGPANNEIWYTSTDGNIVTPYNTSTLPTIVSNTYVNGKGIIKCASDITSFGSYTFNECRSLASITIPNSVTSIGNYAFAYCKGLTSVMIPDSVTHIGRGGFAYCRGLTSITYTGTIAQYNSSITKGYQWHEGVPATVVHCTDGDAPI